MTADITSVTVASNIEQFNYPYKASIYQASQLGPVLVNIDLDSSDNTVDIIKSLNVNILESHWGDPKNKGKQWLTSQKEKATLSVKTPYLYYFDIDEILEDNGIEWLKNFSPDKIKNKQGIFFYFLHFFGDYFHLAKPDWKWYKQAVRFSTTPIGFINQSDGWSLAVPQERLFTSNFKIFHYGHIREEEAYSTSKKLMFSRYGLNYSTKKIPDLSKYPVFQEKHPKIIQELYLSNHS